MGLFGMPFDLERLHVSAKTIQWWMRRYEDDRDEGEWFLYTGSGGRDLSGNKRVTNVRLLATTQTSHRLEGRYSWH